MQLISKVTQCAVQYTHRGSADGLWPVHGQGWTVDTLHCSVMQCCEVKCSEEVVNGYMDAGCHMTTPCIALSVHHPADTASVEH